MTLWWLTKTSTLAVLVFLYLTPHFWQIWTYLTFVPLTTGQTKILFDGWHWTTHWHARFCCWRLFKIWPCIETNLDFSDLRPLIQRTKKSPWTLFDGWHQSTHYHSQFCCWRLFKIWPLNSGPKWPQDELWSKIPEHPKRTSSQGSLHPNLTKIYRVM